MLRVRLNVEPDGSLVEFSVARPDVELRLQAGWRDGDQFLSITEVDASDAEAVLPYFDEAPEVDSYDVVHEDDEIVVIRARITNPEIHQAAQAAKALPRFPLRVRGG